MDVRYRYHNDPLFHQAVDMMAGMLERGMLTTADMAHAVVVAAQLYAERNRAPTMIMIVDAVRKEEPRRHSRFSNEAIDAGRFPEHNGPDGAVYGTARKEEDDG